MQLDIRKIPGTPLKLILSNKNVVGILERREHKEMYITKKNFSEY
jgi:hypothetical protein